MERKLYSVSVFKIDFNTDTSLMKKDYGIVDNANINGVNDLAQLIVYKDDKGIFRELISGIQIPVVEEEVYLNNSLATDEKLEYSYHFEGDYPVFFVINVHTDVLDGNNAPQLEDLEASEEYIQDYKKFVEERYTYEDSKNYKQNWTNKLKDELEANLLLYGEILEDNGYSDGYKRPNSLINKM